MISSCMSVMMMIIRNCFFKALAGRIPAEIYWYFEEQTYGRMGSWFKQLDLRQFLQGYPRWKWDY